LFRKIMRGRFVILAADTSDSDTAQVYRVKKKLAHEFQRVAHFVKREGETLRERWRLFEFSMVFGQSLDRDDSTTVKTDITIVKLLVEPSEGDTVEITDPLSFFQTKRSVFAYTPGTEVKLTVHVNNETNNPLYFPLGTQSTELVRLHHTRHRKHRFHGIKPFTYVGQDADGNNIYEGSWVIGNRFGVHHAVIDVIDNGTIHDDDEETYPYSSTTWSSPYKVKMMN